MKRTACLVMVGALVGACAAVPEPPRNVVVQPSDVPVTVPCSADPGPAPVFPDAPAAVAAASNIFERAKLYASGRQVRLAWEARLEAANAGCRAPSR